MGLFVVVNGIGSGMSSWCLVTFAYEDCWVFMWLSNSGMGWDISPFC